MGATESWRDRLRRLVGLAVFLAMVGGFTLSFAGTPRYEQTILTWLGYPAYNTPAFLIGMSGLVALVGYGYYETRHKN